MTLKQFLQQLEIKFNNLRLYEVALTHRSYINEHPTEESYEKLEFFGDSIINFVVANFLYQQNFSNSEELSVRKNFLISNRLLAVSARNLKIEKFIKLGKGNQKRPISESILADCFEALIAAMYLDLDNLNFVIQFLKKHLINPHFKKTIDFMDYKSLLQEFIQKQEKKLPQIYQCTQQGEFYEIVCQFKNFKTTAIDKNKKTATKKAAKLMLEKLKILTPSKNEKN